MQPPGGIRARPHGGVPGPIARLDRVKTSTAWIVFSLLRLLFFAVPFMVLHLIGWPWYFSVTVAALISVSLSIILLSRPRERAALSIQEWRDRDRTADDIAEDAVLDSSDSATPPPVE